MRNTQPKRVTESENLAKGAPDGLDEAQVALTAALEKKALEPVLLDVRGLCSYANYILIVSGRSDRQVEAIASAVSQELKKQGAFSLGSEGKQVSQWALLDFGDLVVHVFYHPIREHYDLEGLWIDAPRVQIDVPDEARIGVEESYSLAD